jgi:hypothetical protein
VNLVREFVVNDVTQVNESFDFGSVPVRGFELSVDTNTTDPIILKSGAQTDSAVVVSAEATGSGLGGVAQRIGGCLTGPFVTIDWQGNTNFKQAVFRFYDEPIPPYGRMVLARRQQLALGAGATTAFAAINRWGSWARKMSIFLTAQDATDFIYTFATGGTVSFPQTQTGGIGAGGGIAIVEFQCIPESAELQMKNTSAGASDVAFTFYGTAG